MSQAIRAAPSWSEPSPLAGQSTGSPDSVIGEPTPAEWARHLRAARDRGRLALPLHPSEVSETGLTPALCFFLGALLLHPSAVEAATSAMEVVAVSGANAALLVAQRIGGAQRRQGGGGDGHDKVAPRDEL